MKTLVVIIPLICCLTVLSCTAKQDEPVQTAGPARATGPTYELYSWQNSAGSWDFCLMHTISRNYSAEEIFDKKSTIDGLDRLSQRISELPAGSDIVWYDSIIVGGVREKGTEALGLPPKEMIDEVKRYAAQRNVTVHAP